MRALTLKNVPEHLHARLKESAKKSRRSLERVKGERVKGAGLAYQAR
jgi:hypothetical protein